jgi:hypothetical protein
VLTPDYDSHPPQCINHHLGEYDDFMNLDEKLLLGWLLGAWLIPIGLAWPQRRVSPLWAWARIVAAAWMFSVLELMVWFPGERNLNWALYAGIGL